MTSLHITAACLVAIPVAVAWNLPGLILTALLAALVGVWRVRGGRAS